MFLFHIHVSLQTFTVTRNARYKQGIQRTLTQLKTNILS